MKLFLWQNVLCDYTEGVAFAIADNEDEARQIIMEQHKVREGFDSVSLKNDLKSLPVVIEGKFGFYLWGGG